VFDGDTDHAERARLTDEGRVLITNPDMLHCTLLPNHKRFARILGRLRVVVVDEAHAYQGVFGAHTALVLRRLRRLAWLHGAAPTFVICSATIANPVAHAAALTALPAASVQLVSAADDGSPCGEKRLVLWNAPWLGGNPRAPAAAAAATAVTVPPPPPPPPSVVDTGGHVAGQREVKRRRAAPVPRGKAAVVARLQAETAAKPVEEPQKAVAGARRASPIVEAAALLAECACHGLRTLAFCGTRKLSELVLSYAADMLARHHPHATGMLAAYRAGYTPLERRALEAALRDGSLRGVACTNALELGLDLGRLDVTLHLGFPGTVASLWQQAGRAGRREQTALSILVAFDSPLDQYFVADPTRLLSAKVEHAVVDPSNARLLQSHLACAAFEHPLLVVRAFAVGVLSDQELFGPTLVAAAAEAERAGLLGRDASLPAAGASRWLGDG
jgi:DEAD/DEAH box helicase domain-containing protein